MMNRTIGRLVEAYLKRHPADTDRLSGLSSQLLSPDDITARSNMAGHVTSSALILDPSRTRALLIHHATYDTEIPPGGHVDPGEHPYATALREPLEETGIYGTRPVSGIPHLLDIDTHPIPGRPEKQEGPHRHHDMMWLELCDSAFTPVIQASEIRGARWVSLADMARDGGRNARLAMRVATLPREMLI